jgi:hypothetical protein
MGWRSASGTRGHGRRTAACLLASIAACAPTWGSPPPTPPQEAPRAARSSESASGADAAAGEAELPAQGQPCKGGKCAPGLTCLTYYGVAGPRGPPLSSCEIPCAGQRAVCPEGQTCATIADGPGPVCQPAR